MYQNHEFKCQRKSHFLPVHENGHQRRKKRNHSNQTLGTVFSVI